MNTNKLKYKLALLTKGFLYHKKHAYHDKLFINLKLTKQCKTKLDWLLLARDIYKQFWHLHYIYKTNLWTGKTTKVRMYNFNINKQ